MPVAKVAVLGVLIACGSGASALGGPMLVLGTFSTQPARAVASASIAPTRDPAPTPLRLGFSANPGGPSNPPPASPSPAYFPPANDSSSFRFSTVSTPPVAASSPAGYDAFINLGHGPYPSSGTLTSGNALPWAMSQPVSDLFGGIPTPRQQAEFAEAVARRVEQTFRLSGVPVSLTTDPNADAAHTLSVVGNTVNPSAPKAIGMTYIGGNGFHFIDRSASLARTVDQLQWIVAHNVAHELMLAFGVPEVHDQSGRYIDATTGSWAMLTDPNARFSPGASKDLLSRDFRANDATPLRMAAQFAEPEPVPEPATLALWGAGALALWAGHRRSRAARPAG